MDIKIKVFIYISAWIAAWIAFSLAINTGLIMADVYAQGGKGAVITFFITSIIALGGAISLYKEVFQNKS